MDPVIPRLSMEVQLLSSRCLLLLDNNLLIRNYSVQNSLWSALVYCSDWDQAEMQMSHKSSSSCMLMQII